MAPITRPKTGGPKCTVSIWILLLSNILVFQLTWYHRGGGGSEESYDLLQMLDTTESSTVVATGSSSPGNPSSSGASAFDFILAPRQGKAEALPSVRVAKEAFASDQRYGGKGDKPHLGGFTDMDHHGISPASWKWMVETIGVHSVMDIGCGRGISTSWFYFHGVEVLCAEGSHDAIENTVLPDKSVIVEHDFSRGPWWPEKTYDAVWCVEFLEHVSRNHSFVLFAGWWFSDPDANLPLPLACSTRTGRSQLAKELFDGVSKVSTYLCNAFKLGWPPSCRGS